MQGYSSSFYLALTYSFTRNMGNSTKRKQKQTKASNHQSLSYNRVKRLRGNSLCNLEEAKCEAAFWNSTEHGWQLTSNVTVHSPSHGLFRVRLKKCKTVSKKLGNANTARHIRALLMQKMQLLPSGMRTNQERQNKL